jgi:hypothetical protein
MFYGYFAYRSYNFLNDKINKVKLLCSSSEYRKDIRYRYNVIRRLRSWAKGRNGEKGRVVNGIVCIHLNEHDFNGELPILSESNLDDFLSEANFKLEDFALENYVDKGV